MVIDVEAVVLNAVDDATQGLKIIVENKFNLLAGVAWFFDFFRKIKATNLPKELANSCPVVWCYGAVEGLTVGVFQQYRLTTHVTRRVKLFEHGVDEGGDRLAAHLEHAAGHRFGHEVDAPDDVGFVAKRHHAPVAITVTAQVMCFLLPQVRHLTGGCCSRCDADCVQNCSAHRAPFRFSVMEWLIKGLSKAAQVYRLAQLSGLKIDFL